MAAKPTSIDEYLHRYPRVCAAIIAYSLGYATPQCAASILQDAHERQQNYSEWIVACYKADPLPALQDAIRSRHSLRGHMADYRTALGIVRRAINDGEQPLTASWC